MSKPLKPKRGTTAENNQYLGEAYEITLDTEKHTLRTHDGVTVGGYPLATQAEAVAAQTSANNAQSSADNAASAAIAAQQTADEAVNAAANAHAAADQAMEFAQSIKFPVTSVNGQTGDVQVGTVTSVNGQTGDVQVGTVTSVNGVSADADGSLTLPITLETGTPTITIQYSQLIYLTMPPGGTWAVVAEVNYSYNTGGVDAEAIDGTVIVRGTFAGGSSVFVTNIGQTNFGKSLGSYICIRIN